MKHSRLFLVTNWLLRGITAVILLQTLFFKFTGAKESLVPRVHSSGGHTRMGQVCGNVNRSLKWAFVETGNLIVINQRRLAGTHVVQLYQRIKRSKNHQKAVVAVARHLAEAAWWVLTKQEVYREPRSSQQALSSTHG